MKKITTVFLLVLSLTVFMAIAVSAATIEISTPEQLMSVSGDGSYMLVEDIDLSEVDFTPIGTEDAPFEGVFDGNNKVISGLTFDEASEYVGLFGFCENATIKNVIIDDLSVSISGAALEKMYVSGICAYAEGNCTFDSCVVSGSIDVNGKGNVYAAGVCAYVHSGVYGTLASFTSCINNACVTVESNGDSSQACAAGLAAYGLFADVISSANNGEITALAKCGAIAAGISATYGQRDIKKTYNSANISATSQTTDAIASGLVASTIYGIIEDCYNAGDISAVSSNNSTAGGISAESQLENIYRRCYNAGEITVIGNTKKAGSLIATANVRDTYSSNYVIESETPIIAENSKNGAATELTEEQMKNAASFDGFDFDDVWYMPTSGEYLYPVLRGFEIEDDVIVGDVNGDVTVDRKDLTRLAQYFARWSVEIDDVAADANGDGTVDRKDLTRLAQYFARWEVELG